MNTENLVLCTEDFQTETEKFKKGNFYRCLPQGLGEDIQLMVFGVVFALVDFCSKFQFAHTVVIKEWTEMGLIVDGKPLTKKAFKERLDLHKYGNGRGAFYSGYIIHNHSKELMYQFNSPYVDTKPQFIDWAYQNYLDVIKGHVNALDNKNICRGNSGIPIVFNHISWRF